MYHIYYTGRLHVVNMAIYQELHLVCGRWGHGYNPEHDEFRLRLHDWKLLCPKCDEYECNFKVNNGVCSVRIIYKYK